MNPNNNQQSYYQYHQSSQGPPPPQWQAPPRVSSRWGDPRPSQSSPVVGVPGSPFGSGSGPGQLPIPPPPPIPPSGLPSSPLANAPVSQQYDTSGWGVRHNQSQLGLPQDSSQRPALPPRPPSAQPGVQYGWQSGTSDATPPVPPPRPAEYAIPQQMSQNQYFPHESISTRPLSQRYEPPNLQAQHQQHANVSSGWQVPSNFQDAPVSPIDNRPNWQKPSHTASAEYQTQPQRPSYPPPAKKSSIPAPGASALGYGGPSDWQHYPDEEKLTQQPADHGSQPQLLLHSRQGSLVYSVTPEQAYATPANANSALQYDNAVPPKTSFNAPQGRHSPRPLPQVQYDQKQNDQMRPVDQGRPSSRSDSGRPGSIDSVMNAWNTPTTDDHAVRPLRVSRPVSTFQETLPKPRDMADTHTQTDFPPVVKTEVKIETHEIDPFKDLKNEYRTSLNRYATMLRQEMSVSSEQEKMMVVSDFVNREVKLRAILFNAEPAELIRSAELAAIRSETEKARSEVASLTDRLNVAEQHRRNLDLELSNLADKARQSEESRKDMEKEIEETRRTSQKQIDDANSSTAKEIDELRKASEKEIDQIKQAAEKQIQEYKQLAEKAQSEAVAQIPLPLARSTTPKPPPINTDSHSNSSKDDGFVVVNADDEAEYSPGGRPRVTQSAKTPFAQRPKTSANIITPLKTQPEVTGLVQPPSPASNAPMTLDDYNTTQPNRSFNATPVQISQLGSAAPLVTQKIGNNQAPIAFQPPRPAYTPFQYSHGVAPTPLMLHGGSTADQVYSKLRFEQTAESGRLLSQAPPSLTVSGPERSQSATPSRARQQHEEAFIGLLRSQSKAVRRPQTVPPPSGALGPFRAGTPQTQQRQSLPPLLKTVDSLRQSVPSAMPQFRNEKQPHPMIASLFAQMTAVVDDFSYIKATVVAWDKSNRQNRQKLETERAHRESENEARIDQLFNDNEIGYADVAALEDEFKVEEAGKKYDEDEAELDSFSINVFEVVTARLDRESTELEALQKQVLDILQFRSQSASDFLRSATTQSNNILDKVSLSEVMSLVLDLYSKIDIRKTKLAEAKFERERRRKRLELSVLYTNGDSVAVKKLEDDFDHAQAMQVYAEAQKRDDRANKLMDGIDRATVQGLADNQEWVDEISNKASLLRDLVLGSESNGPTGRDREELLYGPGGVKDILESVSNAITMISQDSRDLVDLSTRADKILNEADFAMMLADTKTANRDQQEFEQLKDEKMKEDQKLKEEYESRMNSVQRGPNEVFNSIKEIRDKIGSDPEHQTRINQALERARERNQSPT